MENIYSIEMEIVGRLLQFIEYKNISKRKFYQKTGLSNGFLDKISSIGSEKLENIISEFPELNIRWLITGQGEMIDLSKLSPELSPELSPNSKKTVKNSNVYKPPDSSNEPVSQYFCDQCKRKQEIIDAQKDLIDLLKDQISALKYKLNDTDQTDKNGQKRKAS